jgi:hypothetical protein
MITFQAIPRGVENEGTLRPPRFAFFRAADFVKYGFGAMAAGIAGPQTLARMIRMVFDQRVAHV